MSQSQVKIIDGKKLSEKILNGLRKKIIKMSRPPGLAAVLVGDDPASHLYVSSKKKACLKVGIDFYDYFCGGKDHPGESDKDVVKILEYLNNDKNVDGVIVQLPLPEKFNIEKIIDKISPTKDVDGFLPQNQKNLLGGKTVITPPLIQAVNAALKSTGENFTGKKAVIVSKSPIFSDPMKLDLEKQGLTVEIIKPDKSLAEKTSNADVLISIVGKPHFIKKSMIKKDAIVIDVGTTLTGEKKWAGDVDPKAAEVAKFITPVPGGIGPLTVAMLLKNTYELAVKNQ